MASEGEQSDTLGTRAWWLPIIEERILQTKISQLRLNSSSGSRREHEEWIGKNLSRLGASGEIDGRIFGRLTDDGELREEKLISKSSENRGSQSCTTGRNVSSVRKGSIAARSPGDRSARTSRTVADTKAIRSEKDLIEAHHLDDGGSHTDHEVTEASSHTKNQASAVAVDDGGFKSSPHVSQAGSSKGSPKTQRRRERRRGKLCDKSKDQTNNRDTSNSSVAAASPSAKARDGIPNSSANKPFDGPTPPAELDGDAKHFDIPRSDIKTPGGPGSNLRELAGGLKDAPTTQPDGLDNSTELNLNFKIPASIEAKRDSAEPYGVSQCGAVTQVLTPTRSTDTLDEVSGFKWDRLRPTEPDSDSKDVTKSVAEYVTPSILLHLIQEAADIGTHPASTDRFSRNVVHNIPEMAPQNTPEGLEENADMSELSARSIEKFRTLGDSIDAINPDACCTNNLLSNETIHGTSDPCLNESLAEEISQSSLRKNIKGLDESDHTSASNTISPGFADVVTDHSMSDLPRKSTHNHHLYSSEDLPDDFPHETLENSNSDPHCSSVGDFTEDEALSERCHQILEDEHEFESSGTESGYDTDESFPSNSSEVDTYTLTKESSEARNNRNLDRISPLVANGAMGLIWTYATHTEVDKDLLRAGIWLFERVPNYFKSQPYVYRRHGKKLEQAPVVLRTLGGRDASLQVQFDGEVLYINTHGSPWPDMRFKHSHPDMLPISRLLEYQAAESMGLDVWRHDRNLLDCRLPGCKCKLSDINHSTIICAGCGPKSIIRYCSVEHQVLDLRMHWEECGHRKLIIKRIIDQTTEPARFKHLCPAIRDCKNTRSFANFRRSLYTRLTYGRYTLFNPKTGHPTVLVWSRKDHSHVEMERRVERLLNCALFDQRNKVMVTFLFRMVQKCLQSKNALPPETRDTLTRQFKDEFALDASRIENDEVCECEWEGENLPENMHLPNCRKLYRNFSKQFQKTGIRGYLEMYEKRYWILRAWQQQHSSVKRWRDRVAGKGFPDGAEGTSPSLGPGFVCWGAKRNDSCL